MRNALLLILLFIGLGSNAQQIIIPEPPMPRPAPGMFALECRSLKVETTITGTAAQTVLNQLFYNPTAHQLEGYYFFPLPEGATVRSFSMFIDGKETVAELLDAEKARKIYEDIVRKNLDPALLEYKGKDLLRVRIFPIRPRTEVQVRLQLNHSLIVENGLMHYSLPIPRHKAELVESSPALSMRIQVNMPGETLKTIYSPTHAIEINREGKEKAVLGYEGPASEKRSRFELFLQNDARLTSASLLTYHKEGEDGYFLLNLDPGASTGQELRAKDVTFVLDASGSMAGARMEQAQKALRFCLENLNEEDRFNIVRFSTEASALFTGLQGVHTKSKQEAVEYIDKLRAIGGTNVEEALQLALQQEHDPSRPYLIVFLTDGKPTIGETRVDSLLKKVQRWNEEQVRIFTFGIGVDLDTRLLDLLSAESRGSRAYVLPEEDIELKVSNFFLQVASPVLTDVELELESKKVSWDQHYPRQLPDLFRGSNLNLMGRYNGSGKATLTVKGKVDGKEHTMKYELDFPEKFESYDYLPALWGTRAVGFLLDQIRLNGESEELVQEVVRLAKKYGTVTPYTSYLILEDEVQQIGMNRLRPEDAFVAPRTHSEALSKSSYEERMQRNDGRGSVEASEAIQRMNQSDQLSDYPDNAINRDIAQVQGRAFYRNERQWIDAKASMPKNAELPKEQIRFQSKAYFELLENEPGIHEILALGTTIRFVWNGRLLEIVE